MVTDCLPASSHRQAQRYITQLKSQINSLEADLEEQRVHKQRALVENEQLRMELEATRRRNAEHEIVQATFGEAESKRPLTKSGIHVQSHFI